MSIVKMVVSVIGFAGIWLAICAIRSGSDNRPYNSRLRAAARLLEHAVFWVIVVAIGYGMHILWPGTLLDVLSIFIAVVGGFCAMICGMLFAITPFVSIDELTW